MKIELREQKPFSNTNTQLLSVQSEREAIESISPLFLLKLMKYGLRSEFVGCFYYAVQRKGVYMWHYEVMKLLTPLTVVLSS